jgi:hypothetical protein
MLGKKRARLLEKEIGDKHSKISRDLGEFNVKDVKSLLCFNESVI